MDPCEEILNMENGAQPSRTVVLFKRIGMFASIIVVIGIILFANGSPKLVDSNGDFNPVEKQQMLVQIGTAVDAIKWWDLVLQNHVDIANNLNQKAKDVEVLSKTVQQQMKEFYIRYKIPLRNMLRKSKNKWAVAETQVVHMPVDFKNWCSTEKNSIHQQEKLLTAALTKVGTTIDITKEHQFFKNTLNSGLYEFKSMDDTFKQLLKALQKLSEKTNNLAAAAASKMGGAPIGGMLPTNAPPKATKSDDDDDDDSSRRLSVLSLSNEEEEEEEEMRRLFNIAWPWKNQDQTVQTPQPSQTPVPPAVTPQTAVAPAVTPQTPVGAPAVSAPAVGLPPLVPTTTTTTIPPEFFKEVQANTTKLVKDIGNLKKQVQELVTYAGESKTRMEEEEKTSLNVVYDSVIAARREGLQNLLQRLKTVKKQFATFKSGTNS